MATRQDIDYVLEQANKLIANPLTHDDIIGTYSGLRPLLQPKVKGDGAQSTKVSREHTVTEVAPGSECHCWRQADYLRVMAADAVDFALGRSCAGTSVGDGTNRAGGCRGVSRY